MRPAAEHRRVTFARGRFAEWAALVALLCKGYRPLARRFAAAGGEVDLIVTRGDTIAFVEVKARLLIDDARIAITARKRRRFSRAARAWLSRNGWAERRAWRADAVFVSPWRWPRHLEAAFEIEIE